MCATASYPGVAYQNIIFKIKLERERREAEDSYRKVLNKINISKKTDKQIH